MWNLSTQTWNSTFYTNKYYSINYYSTSKFSKCKEISAKEVYNIERGRIRVHLVAHSMIWLMWYLKGRHGSFIVIHWSSLASFDFEYIYYIMKISGFCALFLMVVVTAFAFRATGPSWFSGKSLVIMKISYNIIIRQSLLVKK
jgi:hypothetical protein